MFNVDPTKGRILDNATTLGAVSSTTFLVPANKRWLVLGGYAERDSVVAKTFQILVKNVDDKTIERTPSMTAAATDLSWGMLKKVFSTDIEGIPLLLKAGDYVQYSYGGTQTSPEVALIVIEYDI